MSLLYHNQADTPQQLFMNEQLWASLDRLSDLDRSQLYGIFQAVLHDRMTEQGKQLIEQATQKLM